MDSFPFGCSHFFLHWFLGLQMLSHSWFPPFRKGPLIASQLSFPLLFFTGLIVVGNHFVLFCSHNYSLSLKYPQATVNISAVALLTGVTTRKWLKPWGWNGELFLMRLIQPLRAKPDTYVVFYFTLSCYDTLAPSPLCSFRSVCDYNSSQRSVFRKDRPA